MVGSRVPILCIQRQCWDKHNNIKLIEEGLSSYYSFDEIDYDNVDTIYLSNYFNQINYQDERNINKVVELNKNVIKNIISKIKEQNNLDFKYLQRDNQILFLSQYIFQDIMNDEALVQYYKRHIDELINKGYNVLFKSHPRVNDIITNSLVKIYKNNNKFAFVPAEIKYPVELMIEDLNLKAIVSSNSGGAINCSHLYDVPCYNFGANLILQKHQFQNVRKYSNVFKKYIKHISEISTISSVESDYEQVY